jgi:hypothetical protein
MAAAAVTAKKGTGTNGDKPKVATVPFVRASRKKSKQAFQLGPFLLTAAPQVLNPIQIPPGGFLSNVDVYVSCVTAGNAAAVTFAADGPWNVITYVDLRNSAGDSLIVPLNGYQVYLINKWGVLGVDTPNADPRQPNNGFTAVTGAGATGGSFTFFLRIPLEFDPRDAIASVPNLAANKSYQLQFNLGTNASIYGTPPTSAGSVTLTGVMNYWSQPNSATQQGGSQEVAPVGNGSVSLWRLQPAVVAQGDRLTQLLNVGNVLRTIIFTLRTAAGVRTSADWAATSQVILNDDILFYKPVAYWTRQMSMDYGLTSGAIDTAAGLDTGVFVVSDFNNQRGAVRADGPRDQFLVTYNTTLLQLRSTSFGASASALEIITNEIKPISAQALYSLNIV